ncbi:MAG TPA: protein kinase [Gemmatimonadaceae bacterium]|nr:protein kinase [Gemmatimonadaceae bacterium]
MPLRDQLQDTLGAAYTITRELGGGGMSRVFVAREESLRRNVVVKVLPPELLAGVNAERFDREIAMAAGLQHPHIVPVLTAGQMDGVPYYTMPFVDGESLRGRLTTDGALPITECIGILRDVAKALAYAHERGIVHRDIKPDNVLLSGGSAVVTDFGIAKALSAARTDAPGGTLTQIGTSLGTPAYMSPEQAAADPATDHRADIYSFGCLAYEMIAGRPPFTAKNPQKLLAAQMGETPQPIAELRPDVPQSLATLVMKCLAKDADDRPQRAVEIVRILETVTSGAGHDAMPMILAGGRGMFKRAMLVYVLAFVIVAVVAKAAIVAVGLPDWVFPGALVVMALGLPVILFTAYVHRTTRKMIGATPTYTPHGTPSLARGTMAQLALKASPHWSWRRAGIGGGLAVASFVLLVGGYMALRALGIGPAGSLLAAGDLAQHEQILVADLPNPAGDTTLGAVVTDALRTALGESQSVTIMQPAAIRDVLVRMELPAGTRVDFALAREIATREGIKALVDGTLIGVGGRYVIALKLVSPQSGETLASFRETASSESEILPTIDKLAKRVRAKIGESLRQVQSTPPLERVTTSSLDALKRYVQALKAIRDDGDFTRGAALLEQAIALDTGFAMAYRKLAVEYNNRGLSERATEYIERAFAHRDRLSDVERFILLGTYYSLAEHRDLRKSQAALDQALEIQPDNAVALLNRSNHHAFLHQFDRADALLARALVVGDLSPVTFRAAAGVKAARGKLDSASVVADSFAAAFPRNPSVLEVRENVLWARERYDSASLVNDKFAAAAVEPDDRSQVASMRADLARLHGQIAQGIQATNESFAIVGRAGLKNAELAAAISQATDLAWFLADLPAARRTLDDALARHPLSKVSAPGRTYADLVAAEVLAGRPDRARIVLAQWQQRWGTSPSELFTIVKRSMEGRLAAAAGRHTDAAKAFREADEAGFAYAHTALMANTYDLAGNTDSAIVVYNRFLDRKAAHPQQRLVEGRFLPGVHKRLGELYEARGDRPQALRHYRVFIELWKDADRALQPKVQDARRRVAELTRGTDVRR